MKHFLVHLGASVVFGFVALSILFLIGCALLTPVKSPDASIDDLEQACVATSTTREEADLCRVYVRRAWLSVQGITEVTHQPEGGALVEPPAKIDAAPGPVFHDDPTPMGEAGGQ